MITISQNDAKLLRDLDLGRYVHNGHGKYNGYKVTENTNVLEILDIYHENVKVK